MLTFAVKTGTMATEISFGDFSVKFVNLHSIK